MTNPYVKTKCQYCKRLTRLHRKCKNHGCGILLHVKDDKYKNEQGLQPTQEGNVKKDYCLGCEARTHNN